MRNGRPTDRSHRARAMAAGAFGTVVTVIGAGAAWHGLVARLHRLEQRSTLHTLDAVPVLLWAALVLALLWAALLIAMATCSMRCTDGGSRAGSPGDDQWSAPGGLVGRLAGILLAITAVSSLSATAPAFAATSSTTATVAGTATSRTVALARVDAVGNAKHAAETSDSCMQDVPLPGWVPRRPARTDQLARECAPLVTGKPVADDSGEVVVHRGDTLWSIAAAHLGPHADAQAIAAEWPRWYAANRHVIGDDPDLLCIGTRLRSPDHALEGSGPR
ncbi:LysM peptidoglycan-binding domain-containing protein [Flexivirga oryzae]|uniref:LysM domain-containing protein n=1 Tax=Flexivirga oryzae TaxID=1794944 RepID=A0A839N067_9MICO|nr:LysM domain-containing protein [Flexivirga oryzae]MBB2890757.1 hypothetical protein [Flexivirga oryzae]